MSPRTRHSRFCHVLAMHPHRPLTATVLSATIALVALSYCVRDIVAFNLENRLPIVKYGDVDTYFGYSVAGHIIDGEDPEKW